MILQLSEGELLHLIPYRSMQCYAIAEQMYRNIAAQTHRLRSNITSALRRNTNACSLLLSMLKDVAILVKRLCNFSAACRCSLFFGDGSGSRMTKQIASASRSGFEE